VSAVSLIGFFKGKTESGFGYDSTAEEVSAGLNLAGKIYLLTGCNSGLGKETLRVLSMRGAHVIALARTLEKAQQATEPLGDSAAPAACELSDPKSIAACVAGVKATGHKLDGIICNAGIMALPKRQQARGYELQFFTNHIGHFLLVTGLLNQLSDTGRVVVLSSQAHHSAPNAGVEFDNLSGERSYWGWKQYGQSKLCNILFARALAARFKGTSKTANALHPGVIATQLSRSMHPIASFGLRLGSPVVLKSVAQGAATQCFLATHPSVANISGEYFSDCQLKRPSRHAQSPELAERLWAESERIAREVS
jgi:WW domain-containing oxidoreductase